MQKINPCLWFNSQVEDAVKLYTSLFKNSRIGKLLITEKLEQKFLVNKKIPS